MSKHHIPESEKTRHAELLLRAIDAHAASQPRGKPPLWYCCGRAIRSPHCPTCGAKMVLPPKEPPASTDREVLIRNAERLIAQFERAQIGHHNAAHTYMCRANALESEASRIEAMPDDGIPDEFGETENQYRVRRMRTDAEDNRLRAAGITKRELHSAHIVRTMRELVALVGRV